MNDKIKRLAQKLVKIVPQNTALQETYYILHNHWVKQRDYFDHFDGKDLLKLVIYVYSLSKYGSLEKGDQILDKITFLVLFETNGEFYEEECNTCDGNGNVSCENCDGNGYLECGECEGRGQIKCNDCGGTGGIDGESCDSCGGDGYFDCDDCGGDGSVDCSWCVGGHEICSECDGSGYYTTDELNVTVRYVCTWDPTLINLSELRCGTREPLMSSAEFLDNKENIISLTFDETHIKFNSTPETDTIYCIESDDDPNIQKVGRMMLLPFGFVKEIDW